MCVYTRACMHAWLCCTRMHTCAHVYMYVCIYVYVYFEITISIIMVITTLNNNVNFRHLYKANL